MRLFVALEIPDTVKARLASVQQSLDPDRRKARWVRTESIHLTLRFLGTVDPVQIAPLNVALETVRAPRLRVEVRGLGVFATGKAAPRILWAGIACDGLDRLALDVDQTVRGVGFNDQERRFRPHLTLARTPRKGTIGRALVLAARELNETRFGSFTARSFCLYRSQLAASGAIYHKMSEFVFDRETD